MNLNRQAQYWLHNLYSYTVFGCSLPIEFYLLHRLLAIAYLRLF